MDLTRVADFFLIRNLAEWRYYTLGMSPQLKLLPERIVRTDDDCEVFLVRTVLVFSPSGVDEETHLVVTFPDAAVLICALDAKLHPNRSDDADHSPRLGRDSAGRFRSG